ncbi:HAD-IA family hydrolase [Radicibacter daui]|uniref:HAD-IA family hydrolase n=1 Tax=Radicibacter daui TaxID=3064829 RepID=UPI004046D6E4
MPSTLSSSALRLAIFDCDGTLVDSQHSIHEAMSHAFMSAGLVAPELAAVRATIGLSLLHSVQRLLPEAEAVLHDELVAGYKAFFTLQRQRENLHEPLFDGTREALAALGGTGWLMGVATGKGRRGLDAILARHDIASHFVTLQTADVCRSKPDPEMVQRALLEAGGLDPKAAVVIGDTSFDMAMARNAGAWAIGVTWGYHDRDLLHDAGAHVVIDRYDELPAAAARLVG